MKEIIRNRIGSLRNAMRNKGVAACIIHGTDPHASEYIADYWKERVWISGFDGSAGTVVVTLTSAALWTDSRYFLQATQQLEDTGILLMKQGFPETPSMTEWLGTELKPNDQVAINTQMVSVSAYATMKIELDNYGLSILAIDLPTMVWTDNRPSLPIQPIFIFDVKYCGKSALDKLVSVRAEMNKVGADILVLSALDDIAWLFNIRGNDVSFNPVVISYAIISQDNATIYIDQAKLSADTKKYFEQQNVQVDAYDNIYVALNALDNKYAVLVDGAKLNQSLYEAIPTGCRIRIQMSPVFKLKSIKNETEVAGYKRAMVKDGVALTRFFIWLEANVATDTLTEYSIASKLYDFRAQQDGFMGESFGTIAGYGPHGAIVHYSATEESASTLKPQGLFLLDSGGQYLDGTTDITRTVSLGAPTKQEKRDFTLVLKGHIALAMAKFPMGTRGSQLDILARKALWDNGMNYGHGTGHGVGHFLNVHEGPQNIRMDENPVVLEKGMFNSNEPGLYRAGEYGIRIENLVLVVEREKTDFGQFLGFDTLTLFPVDRRLVDVDILTDVELSWLNNYHKVVFEQISPKLDANECRWLMEKCASIEKTPCC